MHTTLLPVVLPLAAAIALLFAARAPLHVHRAIGLVATGLLTLVDLALLVSARDGSYGVYALGAWGAPFGIVLVLDRLSALMLLLTAMVSLAALTHACHGTDRRGRGFHVLFQLQLMGLNGAFLTGDLFNLFVFFEILLIASYGLVLHGAGTERVRATVHYAIINLVGSALFLVGVGVLYGATGTLNMADLAVKVQAASPELAGLVHAAALLLLTVFALKAALVPLYLWLPETYSAAEGAVAALFTVLTKVGIYAILRIYPLVFANITEMITQWLIPLALITLALGILGALASATLRRLAAYLVVASTGTALTAAALFTVPGIHSALFYVVHSVLATAALFLVAEVIARQRGPLGDRLTSGMPLAQPAVLGALFLAGGVAAAGLPPLSGFIGKLLVLDAVRAASSRDWIWAAVLLSSLGGLIALARAGSTLFWKNDHTRDDWVPQPAATGTLIPAAGILALSAALVGFGKPVSAYTQATAVQLLDRGGYIEAVLDSTNQRSNTGGGAP